MSDTTASSTTDAVPDFKLSNAAAGPDPFSLSAVAADSDTDAVVLLFQRDCTVGTAGSRSKRSATGTTSSRR